MWSMTYGNVPDREKFIEYVNARVNEDGEPESAVPYRIHIVVALEWEAMAQAINQGIDSHLEAVALNHGGEGRLTIRDVGSLHTLIRRLAEICEGEGPRRGRHATRTPKASKEEYQDAAGSLASAILGTLGIEWV